MVKASIVIATYCPVGERMELVARSFNELHQTGVEREEYEVIVIANGGIHGPVVGGLEKDLLITCSRNIGQPAALNAGISAARGEFVFQMDDDLSYKPGWLAYGLEMLRLYRSGIIQLRQATVKPRRRTKAGHFVVSHHGGQYIAHRAIFRRVGMFNTDLWRWAGLWERQASRSGYQFITAKEPQITHLGVGSLSLLNTAEKWEALR